MPQPHRPSARQVSELSGSHVAHVAPPMPQAAAVGERQLPVEEQQPAQLPSQPLIGTSRVMVTGASRPFTTCTSARPSATGAPDTSPSTFTSRVCPSSASGSNTRTADESGTGPAGVSGRTFGSKIATPSSVALKRSCSAPVSPAWVVTSSAVPLSCAPSRQEQRVSAAARARRVSCFIGR